MLRVMLTTIALSAAFLAAPIQDSGKDSKDALETTPWAHYPGPADLPGAGHKVVLIAGDEEYRSEEALPMLGSIMAKRHGFDCYVLFSTDPNSGEIDPMNQVHIEGLELLDDADLVVIFTRFREWPDQQMKHFVKYVESGKPIIGIRTATHAFKYDRRTESPYARYSSFHEGWSGGFGRQVLGETWVNHHGGHGSQSTRGVVEPSSKKHPILRGVTGAWGPTDVYGIRDLPKGATILLRGQVLEGMTPESSPLKGTKNDPMMPIAWALETRLADAAKDGGDNIRRTVCSTLGASQDFASEGLRRLMINSAYWCLDLEHLIAERSDVSFAIEYNPTPFGHGKYLRGVAPSRLSFTK